MNGPGGPEATRTAAPTTLPWRPLGETGLPVTRVGIGLAALGRPAYITTGRDEDLGGVRTVTEMEARCHQVLDAALGLGVRYVDTARSYGRAESFLAHWLAARGLQPGEVTIGSKWGYRYVGDWRMDAAVHEEKDHTLPMLARQWAESEATLGPFLGLYQVHSATRESGVLEDRDVLAALRRLRVRGTAVGLSVSGPGQGDVVRRALAVTVDGADVFGCVQATCNLLEPSVGPALADARRWPDGASS